MLRYSSLSRQPNSFRQLTGISLAEFQELYRRFEPLWDQAEVARLARPDRQRAMGGGRPYALDLPSQLVLTLVWLHLYLSLDTLGALFGVHKAAVSRNTRRVLAVLRQLGEGAVDWSEPPRRLGRDASQAPAADLLAILDVTETPTQRPGDPAERAAHYSGKKKAYTRKTGLWVNEHGQIRALTASRPGRVHDLTLWRHTGLLGQLPVAITVVGDKAFEGLHRDLPAHSVGVPHRGHHGHPLGAAEKWANRDVARQRIVVENTLCELKHFRVLVDRFRQRSAHLDDALRAVVALINPRIARRLAQA